MSMSSCSNKYRLHSSVFVVVLFSALLCLGVTLFGSFFSCWPGDPVVAGVSQFDTTSFSCGVAFQLIPRLGSLSVPFPHLCLIFVGGLPCKWTVQASGLTL